MLKAKGKGVVNPLEIDREVNLSRVDLTVDACCLFDDHAGHDQRREDDGDGDNQHRHHRCPITMLGPIAEQPLKKGLEQDRRQSGPEERAQETRNDHGQADRNQA